MPQTTKLSEIVAEIDELIYGNFSGRTFWITAELSGVKKYPSKRWCFFDFVEKNEKGDILIKGVSWAKNYHTIELFEKATGTEFKSGIQITCKVSLAFYKSKSYAQLEIIEIDFAHAIGQLELERQKILETLLSQNPEISVLPDGRYQTPNNLLPLPSVIQRIALITAANSDGQRDFKNIVLLNEYGYAFHITEYLTVIQGNNASTLMIEKLHLIEKHAFDIVVIVRGGGSDTDFSVFNTYELAKMIAHFPIPILTGIGHDRNTSIVDLMARQLRTPTEVGRFIIEKNFNFELKIQQLHDRFNNAISKLLDNRKNSLEHLKQRVKNLNPSTILAKGYAIVKNKDKIITNVNDISENSSIQVLLKNDIIHSTVNKISKNDKES